VNIGYIKRKIWTKKEKPFFRDKKNAYSFDIADKQLSWRLP